MIYHDHHVRVYYEDTDAGGIVYYPNYLKFAERGRTEYLRSLGFENSQIRDESGIIIVVKKVEAEYLSPARLDDRLTVATRLISMKNTSFVMEQNILRDAGVIFTISVVLVCVNSEGKPSRIPESVRTAFLKEVNS